ncbi:MAG: hypothetical protein M5R36_21760 [Deltaproteobacteria bacterium]|nr:hypothetical protein [Deltaproteobacteria bacterium]
MPEWTRKSKKPRFTPAKKKAIEADDLQAVMVSVKQEKIFDLMDAVGKRDRAAALFHLDGMLGAGTHPIPLHAQIANHVKKLLRAKSLAAEGKSRDQVAAEMGGHPFATGKVIDQAKNYGLGELRGSLGLLSHTDFDLKNSRANDRAVLEKLILDLCASSGRV